MWGAQGGNGRSWNYVTYEVPNTGGRGGYSIGSKPLNKNNKLYLVVGGKGGSTSSPRGIADGGYNGGGKGSTDGDKDNNEGAAAGGGATHIATTTGTLHSLVSSKSSVLIVAGGGGGAAYLFPSDYGGVGAGGTWNDLVTGWNINQPLTALYGGYGGGNSGQTTYSGITKGGGQTGSNTYFGVGQDGVSTTDNTGGIGGCGGGYYGGTITSDNISALSVSGSGGSGYIGGVNNGRVIAGNESMPSPTGGTETGHSGNGYCKITWHPTL